MDTHCIVSWNILSWPICHNLNVHAWQAPISETGISLLKDNFDRLMGVKSAALQKNVLGDALKIIQKNKNGCYFNRMISRRERGGA